jgi:hypothetical protein
MFYKSNVCVSLVKKETMAESKKVLEKRFSIFQQEKNSRQQAIELLRIIKAKENDKNRNS